MKMRMKKNYRFTLRGDEKGAKKMKTIAIYQRKGGVGKTVTAVNLSQGLNLLGMRVLLIDYNEQADCTRYFIDDKDVIIGMDNLITIDTKSELDRYCNECLIHTKCGIDLIGTHENKLKEAFIRIQLGKMEQTKRLSKVLKRFKNDYDICIIDCHNSEDLMFLNICLSADMILAPSKTDDGSITGLYSLRQYIDDIALEDNYDRRIDLKILFTMVNRNNDDKEKIADIESDPLFQGMVLSTKIRYQAKPITKLSLKHDLVVDYSKQYNVGHDYKRLATEILDILTRE
ncbi:AAA family ATPase [Erysipelotrichaceae bacterium 66202529]|nr:AAA family ATPase [Erysipelotrichaceae bacterium 66202529]